MNVNSFGKNCIYISTYLEIGRKKKKKKKETPHIIAASNEHYVLVLHHIFIVSCRLSHACIITM